MRLTKRKETTRGLLTLVLVIGGFQLIYLYSNSDFKSATESQSGRKELGRYYTNPVVRRVVLTRQAFVSAFDRETTTEGGKTNATTHVVSRATFENLHNNEVLFLPLKYSPKRFIPPLHDPLMRGFRRKSKGFLTIGIPSVRRRNAESIYLYQTLQSLINNTSARDRREVTVVVLLSDRNNTYNNDIALGVYSRYESFCDEGFIRIIKAPETMYPNFKNLKRTLYDKKERVHWRTKQNIDFAYLFLYSRNISDYYIQLEDDVLSARNFSSHIRNQIVGTSEPWFMLEFSRLGFIGKLFKDGDTEWVAHFLLSHFDKTPGDLLLGKMLRLKGQKTPIYSQYSLFQHIGKFSSLQNKMMPSIDSHFKDADKIDLPIMALPKGKNPPAKFVTSFEAVPGYFPYFAYDGDASTFFWAKTPKRYNYFALQFESPQMFKRIIISTGDPKRKTDSLLNSALYVSKQRKCADYFHLADFVDGEIDTKAMGIRVPDAIMCLKILLKNSSKTWVIIRDIVLI